MFVLVRLFALELHRPFDVLLRCLRAPRNFRTVTRWIGRVGAQVFQQQAELFVNLVRILWEFLRRVIHPERARIASEMKISLPPVSTYKSISSVNVMPPDPSNASCSAEAMLIGDTISNFFVLSSRMLAVNRCDKSSTLCAICSDRFRLNRTSGGCLGGSATASSSVSPDCWLSSSALQGKWVLLGMKVSHA